MSIAKLGNQAKSVINLVKRCDDVTAVDGLSFAIQAREIFCLLSLIERQ